MNLSLNIINPITFPEWDDILLASPEHSIFHSSYWARVLHDSYGYNPKYFTIVKNGRFNLLIPIMEVGDVVLGKRGVGLPFSDYAEPIFYENLDYEEITRSVISYAKGSDWKYVEIRGGNLFNEELSQSASFFTYKIRINDSEEVLFSKFRDSTKRNILKAARENVTITFNDSKESLEEFYRLNCLTRRRHGIPPQPYKFFGNIYENIILNKLGNIILASYEKNNIAGAIYFHFGDKAIYKYGASDGLHQNNRANNLIMWEAIRRYKNNGYKTICLGRTEPENYGLMQYKSGWGAERGILKYYRLNIKNKKNKPIASPSIRYYNKSKLFGKIFRNLPISVSRMTGRIIYKYLG